MPTSTTSILETYLGYPVFLWEGGITLISTLLAGLIIAFVTTFYLKKKEESTRVAGIILEKRVNAQQEILQFMESHTQKLEMLQADALNLRELIIRLDMKLPYEPHIQYADIFTSVDRFRGFALGSQGFEGLLEKHKLWLDTKVRQHLVLMQAYFASINAMLISFNRVPLPKKIKLNESDFNFLSNKLLLILGAVLDEEFNYMIIELETLLVDSIYKLDLTRPKSGLFAKRRASKVLKRTEKLLYQEMLLGSYIRQMPIIIMLLVRDYKGIEITEEDTLEYYERVASTSVTDKPRSLL